VEMLEWLWDWRGENPSTSKTQWPEDIQAFVGLNDNNLNTFTLHKILVGQRVSSKVSCFVICLPSKFICFCLCSSISLCQHLHTYCIHPSAHPDTHAYGIRTKNHFSIRIWNQSEPFYFVWFTSHFMGCTV
jgi:hypothetical protein